MSGNTLGKLFTASPPSANRTARPSAAWWTAARPGMELTEADIQRELDRRKPGTSRHVTQRRGAGHGGNPLRRIRGQDHRHAIALLIRNEDQRSKDYGNIAETFRPGHADYTYWQKYGIRDYRGGGRSSARETAVRVAAGRDCEEVAARTIRRRRSAAT